MNSIKIKIIKDKIFYIFILVFVILSIIPLILILFHIFTNGIQALNWETITNVSKPPMEGGGIIHSVIGTFILIIIASIISIPISVFAGIYLAEFNNRLTKMLRLLVNTLQGLPSIVIGIIGYLWIVKTMKHFSALSGGFALSLMMIPIIIKTTEETIKRMPVEIKEASYALGASYTKTMFKIVLPSNMGSILNGILLSISRIAGETAPLLFTAFGNPFINLNPLKSVDALPLLIFNYAMSPYKEWHSIAWTASLILIVIVLFINILVKIGGKRWQIKY